MQAELLFMIAGLTLTYHLLDHLLVTSRGFKITFIVLSLGSVGSLLLGSA